MRTVLRAITDVVAAVLGIGLAALVVVTVVLVARNRPPQARARRDPYRVRARSMRGWQASAIREIRRAGTQHGRRGRR